MLSKKAKYGVRAVLLLAKNQKKGPMRICDLAEKENIPQKFLESILLELKIKGILYSKMGKGGGYCLGREPHSISVGEVIRVLDGPLAPVPCVSETAYRKCEDCRDERTCSIRVVMKKVRDNIADILDGTTFQDVVKIAEKIESEINK